MPPAVEIGGACPTWAERGRLRGGAEVPPIRGDSPSAEGWEELRIAVAGRSGMRRAACVPNGHSLVSVNVARQSRPVRRETETSGGYSLTLKSLYSFMVDVARRARAEETRRRILRAAFESFASRGYQATTMAAVAKAAGVAEPTMYFSFGSKAALLREVMIAHRSPVAAPTRVADQSWVNEVVQAPDARRAFALVAEHGTEIFRRLAPIADAMTAAGLTDPGVADFLLIVRSERREAMSNVISAIAGKVSLAVSTEHATDVLDVVQSMTTYNGFVRDCAWSTEQYKAWAYQTLTQLLPPSPPARARALDAAATAGLTYEKAFATPTPTSRLRHERNT